MVGTGCAVIRLFEKELKRFGRKFRRQLSDFIESHVRQLRLRRWADGPEDFLLDNVYRYRSDLQAFFLIVLRSFKKLLLL